MPTILQMEAVECGAASLGMILAHYGRWVPLETLRADCGVSRDGSKASNMLRAAREYGLVAKGYKKQPGELHNITLPAVLHWNFNHFVVLEGFDRKGRVHLNNPSSGPVRTTAEELDQAFTGVVLTFEPGPEFRRGGSAPSLLASLRPRLSSSHAALVFVVIAGLALVLPGLVAPSFTRVFVDNILIKGLGDWLRPLLILMGVTALVQAALHYLRQHHLLRLETKLALQTSGHFFWYVLRLPYRFFTQRSAGEIGNRVSLNDRVARLLSGDLSVSILDTVLIVFYGVLMFQYDVILTVVGVATAVANLIALQYMARRRTDLNQRLLQDRGKLMGVAMGGLQTIETLKATGSESDFFARWSGYHAKVTNAEQEMGVATYALAAVPPFLLSINTTLVLGIGGMRVMDGHLTIGMLMAFQALMLAFLAPVNRMVGLGSSLQEVRGDLARLDDVLRSEVDPITLLEESEQGPGVLAIGTRARLEGYLELNDVSFGYSRLEPPLIEHFNLALRPGSRVALVGGSGSGKSTIGRLVTGLYEPWTGEILFDGQPRNLLPRSLLNNSLAMVDQDIFLFEGTVRENLTLWDDTITDAELIQAARDACIHDEIATRPGAYDSLVEEGGRNFSGGQRQRLEIARALAGSASILVLDEATSALDPATEKMIDDNLRPRGCTCLLVAHRLSTIRDCDEILVMDRGKIVQRGTHEELIAVPGIYSDLIASE